LEVALGLDAPEIALIVVATAILVVRSVFSPALLVRKLVPHTTPRRAWRDWTWPERLAVGLTLLVLAGLWIRRVGDLASGFAILGLLLMGYAIKTLRKSRGAP
jgi:hypothetical protein